MIGIGCTNCGITNIKKHIFRGYNYCKEHYEEHLEQEKKSVALSIKAMQEIWSNISEISDDDFNKLIGGRGFES